MMRLLILIFAIVLLFAAQDSYALGNTVGAGALLLLGALVVWMCGYLAGFEVAEDVRKEPDEPGAGGAA